MKSRLLLFSSCLCVLSGPLAQAANRTWDAGAGTTDWFTSQNWSADAMPIVGDNALINMASGVAVAAPGAAATQVQIGTTNGGVGNMTVSVGGGIDALSFVGNAAGSTGSLTINAGAWTSGGETRVGNNGNGTLLLQNGGTMQTGTTATVGFAATSVGAATVEDASSQWNASGSLYVGRFGSGTLTIQNGGAVTNASGSIGDAVGATGVATVTGAGSTWTQSGASFTVGSNGSGTLNIQNGGVVENVNGRLGLNAGSTGVATVNGAGSTWTNTGTVLVGVTGDGTLNVQNGGTVSNTNGTIGSVAGSTGAVTVTGTGSTWASTGNIVVGSSGAGTLNVQNGGAVSNVAGTIGSVAGSTGAVTVTGAGSTWTNTTLTVASNGDGTLNVQSGGRINSTSGRIGLNAGTGITTIDGTGSIWANSGNVTIGNNGGPGTINIRNGGTVENINATVGVNAGATGTATVTGAGSTWVNASLVVGSSGNGAMNIQNGGAVNSTTGRIGSIAGSTGVVTVNGAGSAWINTGSLLIGAFGDGALTVQDGGTVTNTVSDTLIANDVGSTGTLNIGGTSVDPAAAAGTFNTGRIVFGTGTGSIIFNHTDLNYVFDADISGNGTLNLLSGTTKLSGDNAGFTGTILGAADIAVISGTTNVEGDSSAFAGTTDVMGGILRVNGSLGGDTTISGTGRLQGNATLVNLIVDNGGTAAPGNSIGTVNVVNTIFNPGSTYEVEVNSAGQSDLIDATGTATINGGTVVALPFPDYRLDQPYTIITAAGGVAGTFDDVSDNFLFLDAGLTYDANNVYLTLMQSGPTLESASRTHNQRAVAQVIDSGGITNAGVVALVGSQTNEDLWQGLDALSGEIHASLSGVLMKAQSLLQNAGARDQTRLSGDGYMWVRPFGHFGDVDHLSNTAALDERTYGILAGVETDFDDMASIGFGFGVSRTSVDADARASSANSNNYHALLYVEKELDDGLAFNGGISYSFHRVETERDIAFGSFSDESDADYNAHTGQIYTEVSHRSQINRQAAFEPYVQGTCLYQRSGNFHESGEAGLTGNGVGYGVGFADIGFKTEYKLATKHAPLIINTNIGYRRTIGNDDPSRDLAFNEGGNHFSIEGAPIGQNALILGANLTAELGPVMDFTIGYNGAVSHDSKAHEISARVNVAF